MALTTTQINYAVEWNPIYARSQGWQLRYADILEKFGLPSTSPMDETFAQKVADWQGKHPPLTADGVVGPNTWKKLELDLGKPAGTAPIAAGLPTGTGPRWLQFAQGEAVRWSTMISSLTSKQSTKAETQVNWDEMYFQASPYYGAKPHADGAIPGTKNLDWCAAFANWCLHQAGYSHTGSAGASSFLKDKYWRFDALEEPKVGCVLVPNNGAHVTFLWQWDGTLKLDSAGDLHPSESKKIWTLGGNQGNRVVVKREHRVLTAARGSNGVKSPFLWPLQGEARCTITSVPTEQGHFCGINPA